MPVTSVGIDLGTTFSVVGKFENGSVYIIANRHGSRTTSSVVSFGDKQRLIGDAAKNQATVEPANYVTNVKRFIGQKFNNPKVQYDVKQWPHKTVCGEDNNPMFEVRCLKETKLFAPEQISAMILSNVKETVETFLGYTVQNAVITVPAYFNDSQRQATKDAGKIAGFNVIGILNEPTAAAIAYGFDQKKEGKKNILVYDLGGGTFDVTILTVDNGTFDVKATAGDVHLGGEDFDNELVEHIAKDIMRRYKKDIKKDAGSLHKLRDRCEKAKRALSAQINTVVDLTELVGGKEGSFVELNRNLFERLCEKMFDRTLMIVEDALNESKMTKKQIDDVVVVGGSTRIPKIEKLLTEFFNGKQLSHSINVDEAVAYGATIYADMLSKKDSQSLVWWGMVSETSQLLKLNDVTPLSLGIHILGGKMSTIIRRNTTLPVKKTSRYLTIMDYQETATIFVYEGEENLVADNNLLGSFKLTGLQKVLMNDSKIDVTFHIDVDGILEVTAVDKNNGSQNSIKIIQRKGRLSDEEIKQMIADERSYKAKEILVMERNTSENKLRNLLADIDNYRNDKLKELSRYTRKAILNEHSITTKWLEKNASTATKNDLDEQFEQFKDKCRALERFIGRSL